jgi:hypothetical protein
LAQQNKLAVQPPAQIVIKRGATAWEKLRIMTLPGFHVNSDKPNGEYIIPLTVEWVAAPLAAGRVTYPKPELLKVGNDTLSVFTGDFIVESQFEAPPNAPPGPATITGKIHYQACNTQMCFRPSTLEVHVPVLIE